MQEVTETVLRAVRQASMRAVLLEGTATLAHPELLHSYAGSQAGSDVSLSLALIAYRVLAVFE